MSTVLNEERTPLLPHGNTLDQEALNKLTTAHCNAIGFTTDETTHAATEARTRCSDPIERRLLLLSPHHLLRLLLRLHLREFHRFSLSGIALQFTFAKTEHGPACEQRRPTFLRRTFSVLKTALLGLWYGTVEYSHSQV